MQYKAKHIRWAPFAETGAETANALPKLGAPVDIGSLYSVNETLNFNEASGYGDNVRKVYIKEFKDGSLAIEMIYLGNAAMSAVSGAEIDGSSQDITFSTDDVAPYGSIGYIKGERNDDDKPVYRGVMFPKVKANIEGMTATTKGENIQLSNDKLTFAVSACMTGAFRKMSKEFDTEAEAEAWVDDLIKKAT